MSTANIIVLCSFAAYMVIMIIIGFVSSKGTKNNEDYFLGGRNLGGWTAALSAQASDMSGWLLMGLPGSVYLAGTGEVWTFDRYYTQLVHCFGTIKKIYNRCRKLTYNSELFPEPLP